MTYSMKPHFGEILESKPNVQVWCTFFCSNQMRIKAGIATVKSKSYLLLIISASVALHKNSIIVCTYVADEFASFLDFKWK
ncbi:hypothetical protein Back11_64050 [Paenibacillus baekrokdamisoli]|uniref:Uncharacterized protein n=1 Tax=Paenibacillus baekrokdamisoli TaxID=1712516 RepID=A0A3G9J1J8_9BACL|nr:hypothetical protein [Paenibacillus baekrokdamisoli]BBH25060.1 hypothetical protein Back11_64050 [Paenibacillus baekrokdamisoli]